MKAVTQPLSISPASRRSLLGVGGYLDKDANLFIWPVIGGQITFSNGSGRLDVYRTHRMKYHATRGNVNLYEEWVNRIITELRRIKANLISHDIAVVDANGKVTFKTRYDFERFLALEVWSSAVLNIYEKFPREIADYSERFFCASFAADQPMAWRFDVVPGPFEVYITPPTNTLAGITRVRINKGIWTALMKAMGVRARMSCILWEMFYKEFSSSEKAVTIEDIINLLSKKSMSPVDYDGNFDNLDYIITMVMVLKIWEMTRQGIDLPDYKISCEWHSIVREVADAQVETTFSVISNSWNTSQVRVPPSDLPHVADLNILPITRNESIKYNDQVKVLSNKILKGFDLLDANSSISREVPVVGFNEIIESSVIPTYRWVEIKCFNAVDNGQNIAYNRLFGTYHAATLDQEATIIIGSVFPQDLYTEKPTTVGMKLEPRHWKIIFEAFFGMNPIASTPSGYIHFLFGQASIYGPNHYFVDIMSLFDTSDSMTSRFYGFPSVTELDWKEIEYNMMQEANRYREEENKQIESDALAVKEKELALAKEKEKLAQEKAAAREKAKSTKTAEKLAELKEKKAKKQEEADKAKAEAVAALKVS